MSIASAIAGVVSGMVKPAADAYSKRIDKKMAKETAEAKLLQAKVDGKQEIALTELELVAITKKNEASTWKDEYALVLGSSPYVLVIIGSILGAFGEPELMSGILDAFNQLSSIGVPVGEICAASIAAGLGIRLLKR